MNTPSLLDEKQKLILGGLAALGAAAFLSGLRVAPGRAWADLLLGDFYFLSLSVGAVVFIAIQYVSAAGWSTVLRRVPEAMAGFIPAGAALMGAVLIGARRLYPWLDGETDAILKAKAGWLNLPGFCARAAVALALWYGFSRALVLCSRRQDADGDPALTRRGRRLSAAFLAVYAATFTGACFDWVMSLEPHWYSTLFPWYVFSGVFVHAAAVVAMLVILLRRRGLFGQVNEHHLHDLGKYLFAFSAFWAYLWFCQFMLIWYSNIPEEAAYYLARSGRGWVFLQAMNLCVNFLLPFALLLSARDKRREGRLLAVSAILAAGHWLDLYLLIIPAGAGASARPHWLDVPIFLGVGALFILSFDRAFRQAPPIPVKDPFLGESLHHHG